MATARTIYFSAGGIELVAPFGLDNKKFAQRWPGLKGLRYDSFSKYVGFPPGARYTIAGDEALPVERIIYFKKNASLHACSSKCVNATGHNCECSCRGKNHGAGNII
jgi:hypothetical protein